MPTASLNFSRLLYRMFLVLVVCAVGYVMLAMLGGFLLLRSLSSPRGFLADKQAWPKPLAELFNESEIEVYGLAQFLDERAIAQVRGNDELIEELICRHSLKVSDASHPLSQLLRNSLPKKWKSWTPSDEDRWYTTQDFGSVHLEGQDLF